MTETLKQIAARLAEIREDCDMTPEQVAAELGITPQSYLQYETAKADIPVSRLYEMARIFNVEFTELLTGTSPKLHSYCLVRAGEGVNVERYEGYTFQSLAYNFVQKKIEPLLVTVEPEENKKMILVTHPGQEFNYVLEGKIKIILGAVTLEMSAGDSIYFDPAIPHGQMASDGATARFLTVILHDAI